MMVFASLLASVHLTADADAGGALSSSDVRQWLELRLQTAALQRRMGQQAAAYDDLPRAFAEQRNALLERSGYGAARFDAHAARIWAAASTLRATESHGRDLADAQAEVQRYCAPGAADAMDMPGDTEDERAQMLAEMRAMGLPEEQLARMRSALEQMPSAEEAADDVCRAARAQQRSLQQAQQQRLDATRRDAAAVAPWLETLEHFEDWYAGNRSDPPALN